MSMLTVKDINYSYHAHQPILKNISFEQQAGEALFLLGPNGSGKSTLLNCLLGIYPVHTGTVKLNGVDISTLNTQARARLMAYVPQQSEIRFPYTVFETVFMGRAPYTKLYSSPAAKDKVIVDRVLNILGIEKLQNRAFTTLSGGEQRLVLIARALVMETPLIVMDEPDAGLDFFNENVLLKIIMNLVTEQQRSLIVATHRLNHPWYFENQGISVRVALIQQGKLVVIGRPSEVITPTNVLEVYGMQSQLVKYQRHTGEEGHYLIPLV